jgi:hypothetical protein
VSEPPITDGPPARDEPGHDADDDRSRLLRAGIVGLAVVIVLVVFAFGRAILNGDYFGECDHVVHQQCTVIHVLGIVMHRDVAEATAAPEPSPTPEATKPETQTSSPQAHEYRTPCQLYVNGHNALLEITGSEAASDCERFVKGATSSLWTTEPQTGTESGTLVCKVENLRHELAKVTDTGGHEYGSAACKQLSGEGWG